MDISQGRLLNNTGMILRIQFPNNVGLPVMFAECNAKMQGPFICFDSAYALNGGATARYLNLSLCGIPYAVHLVPPPQWWESRDKAAVSVF